MSIKHNQLCFININQPWTLFELTSKQLIKLFTNGFKLFEGKPRKTTSLAMLDNILHISVGENQLEISEFKELLDITGAMNLLS